MDQPTNQPNGKTTSEGLYEFTTTTPEREIYEGNNYSLSLDLSLRVNIDETSVITGNILLDVAKEMPNRDFRVELLGTCIRYSQNPLKPKQESQRDISVPPSVSDFMESSLQNHRSSITLFTDSVAHTEVFLEGSQLLRYVGENVDEELKTLPRGRLYLPFEFQIPVGSPPSVGIIGFVDVYFSVQYKIVIDDYFEQPLVLLRDSPPISIEQLKCTTLQFSLRKFCIVCLGSYAVEAIVRVAFDVLQVKIQVFKKGGKRGRPYIKQAHVELIAQIVQIGTHTMASHNLLLQPLDYGILGGQFMLLNLQKYNMRSYSNEIFTLRYFIKVTLEVNSCITVHSLQEERLYLDL